MVDRFPGKPFSFGSLRKTFGPLYLRCDICRRFALLQLGARRLRDVGLPLTSRRGIVPDSTGRKTAQATTCI